MVFLNVVQYFGLTINKIITTDNSCVFTPDVEIIKKIEYKK